MATIQTVISLKDNMSNKIDRITNSVERLTSATQKATSVTSKLGAGFQNVRQSSARASQSVGELGNLIQNLGLAYVGTKAAEAFVKTGDAITSATAKLMLLEGSAEKTAIAMDNVYLAAQRSRSEYAAFAGSVGKLGTLAGSSFGDTNEIIGFVELMQKLYVVSGASQQEMASSMYQLTQAMAKGVLNGDELRSVMEGAPMLAQAIADNLGVSTGKMKDLAAQGQVTAKVVKDSLYAITDDLTEKFKQTPLTFAQAMQQIKNTATKAFEPAFKAFSNLLNDPEMQAIFKKLESALFTLGNALSIIISGFRTFLKVLDAIAPVLKVVLGVVLALVAAYAATYIILGIVKAAHIAAAIATMAFAVAKGVLTGATWASITATITATTAQWGLNAAIYACPVFWIILAIIAIIALLYGLVAIINKVAGTSISATGIIAGVFMMLYAHIYNIIANLWNRFATFAEFLVNLFIDPVYAIKKLFYDLANMVLDNLIAMTSGWDAFATKMANAMIGAINIVVDAWNGLMDLLPDEVKSTLGIGKGTRIQEVSSITQTLRDAKSGLTDWLGDKPANAIEIPRMELKSYGESWNTGYEWGKGIDEKMSKMFDPKSLITDVEDLFANKGGKFDPTATKTGKTADNVGKIKDNTDKLADYGEEDLKYLRDIAERETINRFTTAKLNINMTNNNSISSKMDLDGVISYLTEKTQEALASTAAKAY